MEEKKLSIAARRKMARAAKRTAKKRQLKRKLMAKRAKSPEKLKNTAKKAAKNVLVKKMTGGKSYSDLSISQKQTIDNKLKPAIIAKVAKKLLPKVRAKEKERLKKIRQKSQITESVDPLTIASIVATVGGIIGVTSTLAKVIHDKVTSRETKFNVKKTYELIKRKYPGILKMIKDEKFGKGHLQKTIRNIEKEIPDLEKKPFMNNIVSIIDQLIRYNRLVTIGTSAALAPLNKNRFFTEEFSISKHNVNGGEANVSGTNKNGNVEPLKFQNKEDAKKHSDKVGGKILQDNDGDYYVEFTKIDGPIDEDLKMEDKEKEDNLKDLQGMLDIAKMLSDKSSYFKGRGSKKEYIKMLVHKIKKLSESKRTKLLSKMDAYKKVRKPTLPSSRPMKSKKVYDRKKFKDND